MTTTTMTPAEFRALSRPLVRILAADGHVMDTACQVFLNSVFPDASPEQKKVVQLAFFMGAHEAFAITMGGMDEGDEPTEEDQVLHENVMEEIIGFVQGAMGRAT